MRSDGISGADEANSGVGVEKAGKAVEAAEAVEAVEAVEAEKAFKRHSYLFAFLTALSLALVSLTALAYQKRQVDRLSRENQRLVVKYSEASFELEMCKFLYKAK